MIRERDALHERVNQLRISQQELERSVPKIKLELLSEANMNRRMATIINLAEQRQKATEILEDNARMIAA